MQQRGYSRLIVYSGAVSAGEYAGRLLNVILGKALHPACQRKSVLRIMVDLLGLPAMAVRHPVDCLKPNQAADTAHQNMASLFRGQVVCSQWEQENLLSPVGRGCSPSMAPDPVISRGSRSWTCH